MVNFKASPIEIDDEKQVDYFKYFKLPEIEGRGYSLEAIDTINDDIEKYRSYMINKYNFDIERATDQYAFRIFLKDYEVAVNVFGLHEEMNCKKSFNRFINYCYSELNYTEDKNALK